MTWQALVAPDEGRADLWVPLDALMVDEPALRAKAGFDTRAVCARTSRALGAT